MSIFELYAEDRMTQRRREVLGLLTILLLVCVSAPSQAQIIATKIDAKISNPGFTVADNTLTSVMMTIPDDAQSTQVDTSFDGPVLRAQSAAIALLSNSAFGINGSWSGMSALGSGSFRNARSGGQLDIHDLIDVSSTTLTDGTPVVVTFSFFAAHEHSFFHTNGTVSSNNAGVDYKLGGTFVNLVSFQNTTQISDQDHRFSADLGMLGTQRETGMMDPVATRVDITFDSFVGETIDLELRLTALISGSVVSTEVGQSQVHSGNGTGGIGIAIGASAPNSNLDSQLLFAGPFPLPSEANQLNAESILSVPEPDRPIASLVALLTLGMMSARGKRRLQTDQGAIQERLANAAALRARRPGDKHPRSLRAAIQSL